MHIVKEQLVGVDILRSHIGIYINDIAAVLFIGGIRLIGVHINDMDIAVGLGIYLFYKIKSLIKWHIMSAYI